MLPSGSQYIHWRVEFTQAMDEEKHSKEERLAYLRGLGTLEMMQAFAWCVQNRSTLDEDRGLVEYEMRRRLNTLWAVEQAVSGK